MDLTEILSNPVRTRIIQYLQINGDATTKQISDYLDDIPAPTIYRHVNRLLETGLLKVKEERKVRGTTERLLGIDQEKWSEGVNSDITGTAYQFLMSLYGQFQEYGSSDDADPVADRLCLRTCILRLNDETYDQFLSEYAALLERYLDRQDGGKLRSVSIISSPVKEAE